MRLTELDPRWFYAGPKFTGVVCGISFTCPHCSKERLAVKFSPPLRIETGDAFECDIDDGKPVWIREGDNFETITLRPSIDISHLGHWHGFLTAGGIT